MTGNGADLILMAPAVFLLLGTAGFAMLNVGLSRAHASATLCLTSIGVFGVSVLAYHFIGRSFMYGNDGGEFFPLTLAVFTSSIILGALTERIRVWPAIIFSAIFCAIIFPIIGGLSWGGGLLNQFGFHDFAGSAVIHITAGSAALTGAYIMGPRAGRYAPEGDPIPFPGSNIPIAALGAFLACAGFIALGAGHQGLYDISDGLTNMLLGGAGAVTSALIYVTWRYNKPDTTIIINALLGGFVAVSAGADLLWPIFAVIVGGMGGVLCIFLIPRLDKYKLDDPVGVTASHFACGILGTLVVVLTGHIVGQIAGLFVILALSLSLSALTWLGLKRFIGLRCSLRAERHGLDMEAVGLEAYPDFPIRTAGRPDITQIDRF